MGLAHIARDVGSSTLRVPNAALFGAPRAAPGRDAFAGWGIRLPRAASYRSVAQPENETGISLSGLLVDLADLKPTPTALRHARILAIHLAGELHKAPGRSAPNPSPTWPTATGCGKPAPPVKKSPPSSPQAPPRHHASPGMSPRPGVLDKRISQTIADRAIHPYNACSDKPHTPAVTTTGAPCSPSSRTVNHMGATGSKNHSPATAGSPSPARAPVRFLSSPISAQLGRLAPVCRPPSTLACRSQRCRQDSNTRSLWRSTRPAPRTLRDSDYTLRNSIGTRRHGDHFGDDASSQARSQPFWKQFSIALARSSCRSRRASTRKAIGLPPTMPNAEYRAGFERTRS